MSEVSWVELYRLAGELLMRVHEFIACGSLNLEYEPTLNGFVYRWSSTQGTKQATHVVSIKELSLYRGSLSNFALLIAKTMNDGTVPSRDSSMKEPNQC